MKEKNLKNKKIWKWIIINLFLILFGASIISNITYLPKYFALKNRNDNTLRINISAYDKTSNKSRKLFFIEYQTIMATLGDLMAQYNNTYTLENNSILGRWLNAISYEDKQGKHILKSEKNIYWIIYYNKKEASVGIDSIYLNMNDVIELYYENNNSNIN